MKLLMSLSFLFVVLSTVMMIELSKSSLIRIANVEVDRSAFIDSKKSLNETAWRERCTYKKDGIQDINKVKMVRQKSLRSGSVDTKIMQSVIDVNKIIETFVNNFNEAQKAENGIYDVKMYHKDLAALEAEADKLSNIFITTTDADKRTKIENICDDLFTNAAIMRASVFVHDWIRPSSALVAGVAGAFIGGAPLAAVGAGAGYLSGRHFTKIDP
ncbi:uncharacterized protein LOC129574640 [Sitodiplosis mosellana]|uniref:uncharacterized protein LOC129574640 n=1 Tax=Sitodiplosis mosellana TaxID=263140 RepID=UPI00244479B5|nr:uncharacterized protein LOC129574640 [Sitodiplosis mosellana]